MTDAHLPQPTRDRWTALRAGVVDLWEYDEQVFTLHRGRLLLRGRNESGKSKTLELMLPFLLDGSLRPERLSAERNTSRSMYWNLLNEHNPERKLRTGYVWIEFGRLRNGAPRTVTFGCGLQARRDGGNQVRSWFFRTTQRVGAGLSLVGPNREVLSKKRLGEALGGAGLLHASGQAYRRDVNQTLFGMEPEQYDALIHTLLELRQPKLSKNLDVRKASGLLAESLPPLDGEVVGRLATDFENLEEHRRDVETRRIAARHVKDALRVARRHAITIGRQRSDRLTSADSQYHKANARLREGVERHEAAEAASAEARRDRESTRTELRARLAARDELIGSDAYRAVQRVADLERLGAQLEADRAESERARDRAQAELRTLEADRLDRAERAEGAQADEALAWDAVITAADRAEVDPAPMLGARQAAAGWHRAEGKRRRVGWLAEPRAVVEGLRSRARAVEAHAGERERARAEEQRAGEALTRAREERAARQAALDEAREAWLEGVDGWFGAQPWSRALTPEGAYERSVAEGARDAAAGAERARLAEQQRGLDRREAPLLDRRDALRALIEHLESVTHAPPPAPSWRRARPTVGAPLYLLCDFAADLSPGEGGAIEGALLAAGLLDAWVTPDGAVGDGADHWAVPTTGVTGPSLRDVLTPLADAAVPAERVDAILRSVPLVGSALAAACSAVERRGGAGGGAGDGLGRDQGVVATSGAASSAQGFDRQGRWQAGVVLGRNPQAEVRYIGEAARARERRRQLEEARAELSALEAELARVEVERAAARRAVEGVAEHLRRWPSPEPMMRADARLTAANDTVAHHERAVDLATAAVERASARWRSARDALATYARSTGREGWLSRLDALEQAVAALDEAVDDWLHQAAVAGDARSRLRQAEGAVELGAERLRRAEIHHDERAALRRENAARVAIQRAAIGASPEEILGRLDALRRAISDLEQRSQELDAALIERARDEAGARKDVEQAQGEVDRRELERQAAHEELAEAARAGLFALALPEVPGEPPATLTDAIALARQMSRHHPDVDASEEAIERVENRLLNRYEQLKAQVTREVELVLRSRHGVRQIGARTGDEQLSLAELEARLRRQLEAHERLLADEESRVLADFLTGATRRHLRQRLRRAMELIAQTNAVLADCPTPQGTSMRLKWRLRDDAPPSAADAIGILLRESDAQTGADRQALQSFLEGRLQQARAEEGALRARMLELLDYRRWHQIDLETRKPGQGWRKLTRKAHGAGSGGQKAVLLHLPLFAATSAFYASAPTCPRLVLMDEAFAGVDGPMKAVLMGLLCRLDLDFVLTAYAEWGCYSTVDGLAIYHLARAQGVPGVLAERYVWDGQTRAQAPG